MLVKSMTLGVAEFVATWAGGFSEHRGGDVHYSSNTEKDPGTSRVVCPIQSKLMEMALTGPGEVQVPM